MAEDITKKSQEVAGSAELRRTQPKYIVLDANVFIADYWLRSPSFVLLRDFLNKTNATLVIPKIVFEEVLNHHKEDVGKVETELRKALRNVSRVIRKFNDRDKSIEVISDNSRQDPYQKFLTSELGSLKAEILDYNDVPHSLLVDRDLARRKPFQESGKGYRDTLLWETILKRCIEKGAVTVFVTQNVRDFYSSSGDLHKDLKSDFVARKADKDSLELCQDLPTFTDRYVVPYLRKRQDFAILVENHKVPGLNLEKVVEENMDILIEAVNDEPYIMIGNPDAHEPEVDIIEPSEEFRIGNASEVSENVLLVEFTVQAEVSFTYFLPHSEYFSLSDEESSSIAVLDAEWNDHVMQVEATTNVSFACRLTFDSAVPAVDSFEVEVLKRIDE